MRGRATSDDIKARIIAEMLIGGFADTVAARYGVSLRTVRRIIASRHYKAIQLMMYSGMPWADAWRAAER